MLTPFPLFYNSPSPLVKVWGWGGFQSRAAVRCMERNIRHFQRRRHPQDSGAAVSLDVLFCFASCMVAVRYRLDVKRIEETRQTMSQRLSISRNQMRQKKRYSKSDDTCCVLMFQESLFSHSQCGRPALTAGGLVFARATSGSAPCSIQTANPPPRCVFRGHDV